MEKSNCLLSHAKKCNLKKRGKLYERKPETDSILLFLEAMSTFLISPPECGVKFGINAINCFFGADQYGVQSLNDGFQSTEPV